MAALDAVVTVNKLDHRSTSDAGRRGTFFSSCFLRMLRPTSRSSRPASRQKKTATGASRKDGPCWTLRWNDGHPETLRWWTTCSRVSKTWTHIRYMSSTASRHRPDGHRRRGSVYTTATSEHCLCLCVSLLISSTSHLE